MSPPVAGPSPRRAPSLSGLDGWQQSAPRSLSQMRGRIVVLWFFSLSSPPAMSMVAGLRDLQESSEDVQVIGVHSPDYARDADPQRLGLAAARAGMTWPIAMDHRRVVLNRWQADHVRHGWPCTYVLGRDGLIAAHHDGATTQAISDAVASLLPRP